MVISRQTECQLTTKYFQLYFKKELEQYLDPAFTPLFNEENPRPSLFEWHAWDVNYESYCEQGLDYWGFFSWKFNQKTGITGQQFIDFVDANPGYDVYFVNPFPHNESIYINSWEQCDRYNTKTADIANDFLDRIGYKDVDVRTMVMDKNQTFYANFFIASRKFWDGYMQFSRKLFEIAEQDPEFKRRVFEEPFGYAGSSTAPHFTFLNERLVCTYIMLQDTKAIAYNYTESTIAERYRPYFKDLTVLSKLKQLINQYQSQELYEIWAYYRQDFITRNPNVLRLE